MGRFTRRWADQITDHSLSTPTSPSLKTHPVVRLLYFETEFVSKARTWAWANQGPCSVPDTGTNWPPKWPTQLDVVAGYWHFGLMKRHRDEGTFPEISGIEAMFDFAMSEMESNDPVKTGW